VAGTALRDKLRTCAGAIRRRRTFARRERVGDTQAVITRFFSDLSLPAVVAGFVAVLVGFTSSVVIVFAAAQALGATPAQATSWMWALGLGMGLTSIGLSLWTRQPVWTMQ
jgi:predicted benzoate:H+ symporter BenE